MPMKKSNFFAEQLDSNTGLILTSRLFWLAAPVRRRERLCRSLFRYGNRCLPESNFTLPAIGSNQPKWLADNPIPPNTTIRRPLKATFAKGRTETQSLPAHHQYMFLFYSSDHPFLLKNSRFMKRYLPDWLSANRMAGAWANATPSVLARHNIHFITLSLVLGAGIIAFYLTWFGHNTPDKVAVTYTRIAPTVNGSKKQVFVSLRPKTSAIPKLPFRTIRLI